MDNLIQGLFISILGAGITFLALGLLVLVIYILRWVFQKKGVRATINDPVEEERRRLAAAIAVAVSLQEVDEIHLPGLGQTLEGPPSRWWHPRAPKTG
jgi:Na+-transporting methylmalonyl-CoA/oxaloacetate decarboxylase gamma subunit